MLTSSRSTPTIWHRQWCRFVSCEMANERGNRNLLGWQRRTTATTNKLEHLEPTGSFRTAHRGVLTFSRETVLRIHLVPKARRAPSCLVERLGSMASGSCTCASSVNRSTPVGVTPLLFQILVFPLWMSMLACLRGSCQTISYAASTRSG